MTTKDLYKHYALPTYPPPPLVLESGKGTWVWDEAGERYLDFTGGIAVNTLGHCNRKWLRRFNRQARTLCHTSNLFGNRNQGLLAQKLVAFAGPGRVFFCNSGAEANEGLVKLARRYAHARNGGAAPERPPVILCAENGFHGRTMAGVSATPKAKVREGFHPLLPGFRFATFNDIDSFRAAVDGDTVAVMVESIQGEGGIHPAKPEFLQGLRALCDEHELLLMIDEVQCGVGRTGSFFAYEIADIRPDAIGMAKGLGSGFPIGAFWVGEAHTGLFAPGSHGSTFGGSPLACAAGLATLEIMEEDELVDKARLRGRRFLKRLNRLWGYYPEVIAGVRGRGYMLGLELKVAAADMVEACRRHGLLVVAAGPSVVRLLPPLNVRAKELKAAIGILETVLTELSPKHAAAAPAEPTPTP